jgi:hypothetical protein
MKFLAATFCLGKCSWSGTARVVRHSARRMAGNVGRYKRAGSARIRPCAGTKTVGLIVLTADGRSFKSRWRKQRNCSRPRRSDGARLYERRSKPPAGQIPYGEGGPPRNKGWGSPSAARAGTCVPAVSKTLGAGMRSRDGDRCRTKNGVWGPSVRFILSSGAPPYHCTAGVLPKHRKNSP